MHTSIKQESFRDLVNQPVILGFARQILTESYTACAPGQEAAMQALLDRAFSELEAARRDPRSFSQAVAALREVVFRKGDPDSWFNQLYNHYKRVDKPHHRFERLQPWLQGKRVLDLGCGDGLTALILQQNGYQAALTDVLDYRDPATRELPFALMTDRRSVPFPGRCFDSALVFAVLHHVEEEDLLPLLGSLHKTCQRVIVEEDCYDISQSLPGLPETIENDPQLQRFLSLAVEDQLRYLMFVDYFANAITQGLPEMNIPFNFRTVAGWQSLFAGQGFRLRLTQVMGFQQGLFNRSCHVWFVLDV
jgi:SAM-dependent methyltransferase